MILCAALSREQSETTMDKSGEFTEFSIEVGPTTPGCQLLTELSNKTTVHGLEMLFSLQMFAFA